MVLPRTAAARAARSLMSRRPVLQRPLQQGAAAASTSAAPPRLLPSELPPLTPSRIKPVPSSFYTARPTYIDSLILLEDLTRRTKRALEKASIPMAEAAAAASTSSSSRSAILWLKVQDLSRRLGIPLKSSQYRHIVARLSVLSRYRAVVRDHFGDGQMGEANARLARHVEDTLRSFMRQATVDFESAQPKLAVDGASSTGVDDLGRAYARGRRKESSARVWLIARKDVEDTAAAETSAPTSVASSVLINAQPISAYFTREHHRDSIIYPLRLTGLLGVFNVFALVSGGGNSGQAGATAHGIARALHTYFEHKANSVEEAEGKNSPAALEAKKRAERIHDLLKADGVLKRDPRMVERKKTGLAKARKAYTWVKR
ncbi:ribosomal protein S5 domain 2-like protein [Acaromyces ingoldii]|uniref:Ribosomal protein S5 domain 2-like protein n=1 Tax=Acaromyces ingoldii TaxID=215250 RepID=A0A316YNC8_9BASI|nr:ribosomal protein S5 domain 2-like protein [Acaromyces ingoldii]PWN90168.1 ribosomal protein S5 domain 2-like protein [Acaromyces ingoldii]